MTEMRFTDRTRWDRTPNRLTAAVEARRKAGREILDLTESNPTKCAFDYPDEELRAALAAPGAMSYDPDPRGLRPAREAVAASYAARDVRVDPDHLILTSGTSEAYAFLLRLLCEPGDGILVPRPGYPLLDFLGGINDVALETYPLREADGWRINLEALRRAIGPRTRAVVVVHPNNPTGSFVTREERKALAALCRDRGLALISDEVFSECGFQEAGTSSRPFTFSSETDCLAFSFGGLSKTCGLPGLKCSWLVASGPPALRDEALARLETLADTYLSVNTPVQRALPRILELARPVREQILARVRGNRKLLAETFGSVLLAAEGGWYGILNVPPEPTDEEAALDLLEGKGVLVHPGYFYDFDAEGHLVLSLLPPPSVFIEGIRRLNDYLRHRHCGV